MGLIITTTIQGNRMKWRMIIERFRDNCVSGRFDFFLMILKVCDNMEVDRINLIERYSLGFKSRIYIQHIYQNLYTV